MSQAKKLILITVCMLIPIGCLSISAPTQPAREVNYTRVKLGTPAYVVNEAGKPQVVRVQIKNQETGKLEVGKMDANGMVLIDEPTLEYYMALHEKAKGKSGDGGAVKP